MALERYVLGIDAGGTGVRAALAEVASSNVIEENTAASDSDGGPAPLKELLAPLLRHTGSKSIVTVHAGITKVSRDGVKDDWVKYLQSAFPAARIECVPDYVIAFHGALASGIGIAALAGTGSVVYGENSSGQSARVGGRGWEFGDEGSGAWLTTEMVRRTLRALDGLEKPTMLTNSVCDSLGTYEPAALGEAARRHAVQAGRGFLAPLALSLALQGDDEAKNLFVGAGGWLAAQVRASARHLLLPLNEPVDIAMIGGLWSAGTLLSEPFEAVVKRYLPEATIVEPDGTPLLGAVRMALRAANG